MKREASMEHFLTHLNSFRVTGSMTRLGPLVIQMNFFKLQYYKNIGCLSLIIVIK